VEEKEYYPLSSAQNRLFILQQLDTQSTPYNVFQTVELSGELDGKKLEAAFKTMIRRHDSLRTSFEIIDGAPAQVTRENDKLHLQWIILI
jgi:hypothetical protein